MPISLIPIRMYLCIYAWYTYDDIYISLWGPELRERADRSADVMAERDGQLWSRRCHRDSINQIVCRSIECPLCWREKHIWLRVPSYSSPTWRNRWVRISLHVIFSNTLLLLFNGAFYPTNQCSLFLPVKEHPYSLILINAFICSQCFSCVITIFLSLLSLMKKICGRFSRSLVVLQMLP